LWEATCYVFLAGGGRNGVRLAARIRRTCDSWSAFDVVRFAIAAVLFTAAVLKAYQLVTEPMIGTGLFDSPWFLIAEVEFELFLAFWLTCGVAVRWAWWCAFAAFLVFALVAGTKAVAGERSCGCFGAIPTPPWVSLVIDVFAISLLLVTYRGSRSRREASLPRRVLRWPLAIGCSLTAVVVMHAGVIACVATSSASVGDPAQWVGSRLPCLDAVDVSSQLATGDWTVILHRNGCSKCEDLLSEVESRVDPRDCRVALVELPPAMPASERTRWARGGMLVGRLVGQQFSTLSAPIVLQIKDGFVLFAGGQFPFNSQERATGHSGHSARHATSAFGEKGR